MKVLRCFFRRSQEFRRSFFFWICVKPKEFLRALTLRTLIPKALRFGVGSFGFSVCGLGFRVQQLPARAILRQVTFTAPT